MALMDEFKEERENIKNGTPKQKLAYFWEYYKWYVIIPVIIVSAIGWYIYHLVTTPDTILNGILINTHSIGNEEDSTTDIINKFYELQDIDTSEYSIDLNSSLSWVTGDDAGTANYEATQALMAWIAAGQVDFITGDLDAMTEIAYKSYFVDLSEILTEEQYVLYEPYFLYIDQAVIEQRQNAFDSDEDASEILIPDSTKPEEMEKPVPVMIDMSRSGKLMDIYNDSADTLVLSVTANAPHKELTLNFIDYLTE